MEVQPAKVETGPNKNYQLVKEAYENVLADFNWNLFYEILDKHKIRSGIKVPTKDEKKYFEERKKELRDLMKKSFGENYELNEEVPEFVVDNTIQFIAYAVSHIGANGTITINLQKVTESIEVLFKGYQKRDVKVDFDIMNIFIFKVIFHELMHLHGYINNKLEPAVYNSLNEAITELLSFRIMIEYMKANGQNLPDKVIQIYLSGTFGLYESEKVIFWRLVHLLSQMDGPQVKAIVDSFYREYLRRGSVSVENFISLLPNNLQKHWTNFLKLDNEDLGKFDENSLKVYKELGQLIEDLQ